MTHYELVSSNKQKSSIIMILFVVFIVFASYVMAVGFQYDLSIVGIVLVISGLFSFGSYWFSDQIILGISGAHEANREQHFDFYTVAENLALSQRMPKPRLYVIEDTATNAFATGRDPEHAVICCTTGLLQKLNRSELEGVIAHELSHVQNYDIRLMGIVTILVGLIALLSDFILRSSLRGRRGNDREGGQLQIILLIAGVLMALLSPIIAKIIQLAISRRREFLADSSAIAMTKNPEGLANALERISADKEPLEAANNATAHLYIANPLKNTKGHLFSGLFSTHPPIEERIKALRSL
ncbi:M48 family metallopeptidase [Candidatus Woesebacteria bacterium]|nr:M48 family metallopeptidase [Candidatus Woesebacteria bacterium]